MQRLKSIPGLAERLYKCSLSSTLLGCSGYWNAGTDKCKQNANALYWGCHPCQLFLSCWTCFLASLLAVLFCTGETSWKVWMVFLICLILFWIKSVRDQGWRKMSYFNLGNLRSKFWITWQILSKKKGVKSTGRWSVTFIFIFNCKQ